MMKILKTYKQLFESPDMMQHYYDENDIDNIETEEKIFYPNPEEDTDILFSDENDDDYNGYLFKKCHIRVGNIRYNFDLEFRIPYDENWDESPIEQTIEGYVEKEDFENNNDNFSWKDQIHFYDINPSESFKEFLEKIVVDNIEKYILKKTTDKFNI